MSFSQSSLKCRSFFMERKCKKILAYIISTIAQTRTILKNADKEQIGVIIEITRLVRLLGITQLRNRNEDTQEVIDEWVGYRIN